MGKLRGLVLAGLLGLLVVCAPPAQAVLVRPAVPAGAVSPVSASTLRAEALLMPVQTPPPGPVLDPAQTDKANQEKSRNKLIAGGVAVVLLAIVLWGRRIRAKKRKKSSDQAKGK